MMKRLLVLCLAMLMVLCLFGCDKSKPLNADSVYYADIVIENYGTITVKLDQSAAPISVENFVNLARKGFYDGLTFHRIIEGFMMQGGAPKSNSAKVDTIKGEFTENGVENPLKHTRGAISMARANDMNSASSQFFIVHETSPHLDGKYACFGYVVKGIEIVDAICEGVPNSGSNGAVAAADQPVIKTITIREEKE